MYQKVYLIFWGSRIALVCACSVNIARQLQSQTVQSRRELESATFLESRVCSNSGKSLYFRGCCTAQNKPEIILVLRFFVPHQALAADCPTRAGRSAPLYSPAEPVPGLR